MMLMYDEHWPVAPAAGLELAADCVHVWRSSLVVDDARLAALSALLNADERERVARLRFAPHRRRFAVARGVLRELLGGYLQIAPADIVFQQTEAGKPYVHHLLGTDELAFNISHSHDQVLLAFCRDCRIGVDLELRRHINDLQQIANQFFAADEAAALLTLPEAQQPRLFLHCWTLKEAYIKAIGQGMRKGLNNFSVAFLPGEPVRLLRDAHDPQAPERWQFATLRPHPDYVGALAVEMPPRGEHLRRLHCRVYDPDAVP